MDLSSYTSSLIALKAKIKTARVKMALTANTQLLRVYWEIGNFIATQEKIEGWGAKIVELLSEDLKSEFPDIKGFSPRYLRYMRDFFNTYPQFDSIEGLTVVPQDAESQKNVILQQLVAKLPWSHHIIILNKIKGRDERLFYIKEAHQNNWGRNVLALQIESRLYQRQGKILNNFEATLQLPQADLAKETFKNPYVFEFIDLGKEYQERELEKALTEHLKKFLLELGRGFAFIGSQYKLEVEGDEFFIDLLFYHTSLRSYVVLELKVGEFKPEYTGKLQFYINAIDQQKKGTLDNPTIGILLCKTPNRTVVEYSLNGITKPIGVADFKLKNELPSEEEFKNEIEKEIEIIDAPLKEKYDKLKQLITDLNTDEIKQTVTSDIAVKIFREIVIPFRDNALHLMESELIPLFNSYEVDIGVGIKWRNSDAEVEIFLSQHEMREIKIEFRLNGFKKAGINTFDLYRQVIVTMSQYKYEINVREPLIKIEKLYHDLLSKAAIATISEDFVNNLIEDISNRLENIKSQ